MKTTIVYIGLSILGLTMVGCDDRATYIAREAADRQAQQNTAMADLQKEVAGGTHQLVASDADARQKILDVHHDLQAERLRLDTGWSTLENERRTIASRRQAESVLVPFLTIVGGAVLTALTLGFCWYALHAARASDTDSAINEILISEVLTSETAFEGLEDSIASGRTLIPGP